MALIDLYNNNNNNDNNNNNNNNNNDNSNNNNNNNNNIRGGNVSYMVSIDQSSVHLQRVFKFACAGQDYGMFNVMRTGDLFLCNIYLYHSSVYLEPERTFDDTFFFK